jgi:hypothetical protein
MKCIEYIDLGAGEHEIRPYAWIINDRSLHVPTDCEHSQVIY